MNIALIETGVANTASLRAAFQRLGVTLRSVESPADLAVADGIVLPGVGAFGAGMARLRERGLIDPLRQHVAADRPLLAICLGAQLLCLDSAESPGVPGLGVVEGHVERFETAAVVPQLGWNRVRPTAGATLLADGDAFFANSFRLAALPRGWCGARTTYGEPFVAALERGRLLACQFHPELSGAYGAALLDRWLGRARDAAPGTLAALAPRIIPCLDVRDGRVVKGVQFQGLRDAGDPVERAAAYAAQGADTLALLDVSATPAGRGNALETVRAVRAVLDIPLTVGGGVRAVADAEALLAAGADTVAINSAAVRDPALLGRLADRFGRQCVVLAIDAARCATGWQVVTRGGRDRQDLDAIEWARAGVERGAGEILLTSWDRDGTRSGYDLELLAAVRAATDVPLIASGGAAHAAHLAEALQAGADAVLAASIFHDADATVASVKAQLAARGIGVRR